MDQFTVAQFLELKRELWAAGLSFSGDKPAEIYGVRIEIIPDKEPLPEARP